MKNKRAFEMANAGVMRKSVVREAYLKWCKEHGKMPMNPDAIKEWWMEDWKEAE